MPYLGFRKLSITLTIVVIVANPSCGFTLQRKTTAEAIPGPTTDLALEESLQIKSVKRPNDITEGKNADTDKTIKDKYRFTSELKTTDSKEDSTESTLDLTVADVTTEQNVETTQKEELGVTGTNSVLETTAPEITTLSESTATPFSESLENITQKLYITSQPNNSKTYSTTKINSSQPAPHENEPEIISLDVPNINDQIAIDSTKNIIGQKDPNINVTMTNTIQNENTEADTEISIKKSTSATTSSEVNEKPNIIVASEVATVLLSETDSSDLLDDTSKSASTVVEVTVTKDSSIMTTDPTWKKYITIARKRTGSSEEKSSRTVKEQDLAKAESIQTTLSIPSLEILRDDLPFNTNRLSTIWEPQTGSVTTKTELMPTSETIASTQSKTLGIVSSKRAGFLDSSKRTSARHDETTDNNTEYRTMYEIEATDIEAHEIKKQNGYESQSQLAEDAIKEELMKEEIMSNHEENKRYEDGKDEVKPLAANVKTVDSTPSQTITEDTLAVQPINQDRRTTLYTVGPNYKPMKRIEVQPAKLLVRDPDDNSWRNESISSLGIVFKPKNSSSKSFKEVLKTKTETEFNNLQDKDSKDETPELRERLEKITEVRKSKKKRIDKFGEVVYTDYEEGGSAEGTYTPKSETTSPEIHSSKIASTISSNVPTNEVTSPMTTTEGQRYWKKELEMINKEEMFRDLGLDILTTEKTKKPYNLADYYDTTDEYDADYANHPKIDLKKFTVPFKHTTFPSMTSPRMPPLTTRIIPSRFPDRKPTVQYFPPTTKPQKINVNNQDVDFEKRVQFYTLQDAPRTDLPFIEVASLPVTTDRPEIRPSVRPSDFAMFTPQPPDSLTHDPRVTQNSVVNNGNFNRGTYVIKHYRDFLNVAAKEEDDDRTPDFIPYTKAPIKGVTLDELGRATDRGKTTEADYEYDTNFRKEVLSRFVDNFNQNSDRFKVDFPVLFNTSVVHRSNDDEGRVLASSSTFVKRLYGSQLTATRPPQTPDKRGCEPNCDNITVELSPAYELHYYVPEQEEKEVIEQGPATLPYRYKL